MKPAVLIVDDSVTVRMDLNEAFEAAGFSTTLCATGAAAREALSRGNFALIILDVLLPDADGVDLLREIRAKLATSSTPVMLLSTEGEVADRIRGLRTGADEYIGKPYDRGYVVARARDLMSKTASSPLERSSAPVLVIDDSVTFREAVRSALEAAGYVVVTADSGEEGLRLAVGLRPAAILVDRVLPGIDGPTVISRLRLDLSLRRTPCLLLTASSETSDELRALDAGADVYIRKEDGIEVVLARLSAVLRTAGPTAQGESSSSFLAPKKILVVDDNRRYLEALASQLRQEGYDVVRAYSADEAVELLSVQVVDTIVLDLGMEGGVGPAACRRIKSSSVWRDIPLIALTEKDTPDAAVEGLNAGADDCVPRSAGFDVVRARLRSQLRRKQFGDESRVLREQRLQKEVEAAEARAAKELAETRARLLAELALKNEELEAFSYSVSHDLRAPLRAVDGFAQALVEDYASQLDDTARHRLERIRAGAQRMTQLVNALLDLSRLSRAQLRNVSVDLAALAREIVEELRRREPTRNVDVDIDQTLPVKGDPALLRIALENLLGNAWKYSRKTPHAHIELHRVSSADKPTFVVKDNGAGFDSSHAARLFSPFQRLHDATEFEGSGIGLATVKRIVQRHGGQIRGEGVPGKGATFTFTLGEHA